MDLNFLNRPSYIRLLHASPDAPPVDIYANGRRLANNLAFNNFTPYIPLRPGRYNIEVYPAGRANNPVLRENVNIRPQSVATVAAINRLENLELQTITDPINHPMRNTSYVRVAHLSPNAPEVDVRIDNRNPFRDVGYGDVTRYIPLNPGTYNVDVFAAGTEQRVLRRRNLILTPEFYQTVYLTGLVNEQPPLQSLTPVDGLYDFVY